MNRFPCDKGSFATSMPGPRGWSDLADDSLDSHCPHATTAYDGVSEPSLSDHLRRYHAQPCRNDHCGF